ncbi:MAG: hypothetical protein Q7U24_05825, partial [Sulfurimicrobium sp.]|nr:hypothetical protein [Sulfurimicrobium sp.]
MTFFIANLTKGVAAISLAFGVASLGYASDEQSLEDGPKTSSSKKKSRSKADKSGVKIKIDDLRAELGAFSDMPDTSSDTLLHGA